MNTPRAAQWVIERILRKSLAESSRADGMATENKAEIDAVRASMKSTVSADSAKYGTLESLIAALSSGLTSAVNRIFALEGKKDFTLTKIATLPTLAANAVLDVKVTFPSAMPNTDYVVTAIPINLSSLLLGKISIVNAEHVKTVNDVTIRVKTSVAVTITTESVTLWVVARSN